MRQYELPQNYQDFPYPTLQLLSWTMIFLSGVHCRPVQEQVSIRAETPDRISTFGGSSGGGGRGGGSSAGGRKGGAPKPTRAVNVIQHQNAGPTNYEENEGPVETIELPPAYTVVKLW